MMWWLSFADPDLPQGSQFLGVVIVRANDFKRAVSWTNRHGVNPGGEIRGFQLPDDSPVPQSCIGRLLTRAECDRFGEPMR
jgi:hypothetical protein